MKIVIDIKNIYTWYRESTKEWVISVQASTNSCSLSLNYSAKTLNKAKKRMWKHLPQDLITEEISLNFNNILHSSESDDKLDGDPIDTDKAIEHYEGTLEVLKGVGLEDKA